MDLRFDEEEGEINVFRRDRKPRSPLTVNADGDPAAIHALMWARKNPVAASCVGGLCVGFGASDLDEPTWELGLGHKTLEELPLMPWWADDEQDWELGGLYYQWTEGEMSEYQSGTAEVDRYTGPELTIEAFNSYHAGTLASPSPDNAIARRDQLVRPHGAIPYHVRHMAALLSAGVYDNVRRLELGREKWGEADGAPELVYQLSDHRNLPHLSYVNALDVDSSVALLHVLMARPLMRVVCWSEDFQWNTQSDDGALQVSHSNVQKLSLKFCDSGSALSLLSKLMLQTVSLQDLRVVGSSSPNPWIDHNSRLELEKMATVGMVELLITLTDRHSASLRIFHLVGHPGGLISPIPGDGTPDLIPPPFCAFKVLSHLQIPMWFLIGRRCLESSRIENEESTSSLDSAADRLPASLVTLCLIEWADLPGMWRSSCAVRQAHAKMTRRVFKGILHGKKDGRLPLLKRIDSHLKRQLDGQGVLFDDVKKLAVEVGVAVELDIETESIDWDALEEGERLAQPPTFSPL